MFIILNFLLLFSNTHAFEIHKDGGRIILYSENCKEIPLIEKDLLQWNQSAEKNPLCTKKSLVHKMLENVCTSDITDCVPAHVAKYSDLMPENNGPNCWNLALVLKGILPGLRYSTPEEMAFYMNPPLCRSLKNNEARKAGDVGAIRNITSEGVQESHGFVYISEKLAYSKNGFNRRSPYSLQSLDNVLGIYEVDEKKECKVNELNKSGKCQTAVSYFRCKSMKEYLETTPNISKELLTSLHSIENFENCAMSPSAIDGTPIKDIYKNNLKDTVEILTKYLEQEKKNIKKYPNENNEFILGSIQLRLVAITNQFRFNKYADQYEYDLQDLTSSLKNAIDDLKP